MSPALPHAPRSGRRQALTLGLWLAVGVAACNPQPIDIPPDAFPAQPGDTVVAPQQYIEFQGCPEGTDPALVGQVCPTVNLEMIACSATIGCRDGFLQDPSTREPVFTLTTSLTCGFDLQPDAADPIDVFDSLPGYASRVRCVDGLGNTLVPPVPAFGEHRFFAQNTNPTGDFFLNTAQIVPRLFSGNPLPASCTVESWAALNFQRVFQDPPENRTFRVNHWAPVIEWHATLTPDAGSFDCSQSWVQKHVFFATVHDLPDNTLKRGYPAEHGSLLLRQQSFTDPVGARTYNAIEGIAWEPVRFPNAPNVPPIEFEKRLFTVPYPVSAALPADLIGRPASITPGWSCAETDADGNITHVGFVFTFDDYERDLPPAIIVVDRTLGDEGWDCVRASPEDTPVCRPYGDSYDTSWREVVPCLISHIPTDVPPTCDVLTAGDIGTTQTLCAGLDPEQLSGTAPTGGVGSWTYQWQTSLDGTTWTDIAGATGSTYLPPGTEGTVEYRRVATNYCGTATSNAVAVTVAPTLQPGGIAADQTLCFGAPVAALTSNAAATGGLGTTTYQWESSLDLVTWSPITGATSAGYAPGSLAASAHLRRVASNDCGDVASNSVFIDIAPVVDGGSIDGEQTVCPAGPVATLNSLVAGSGGRTPTSYRWQQSLDAGTWSNVSGATAASYTPPGLAQSVYFRRVFDTACGPDPSNHVRVTVSQLTPGSVTGGTTVCHGGTATLSNVTYASTQKGPLTYRWRSGSSAGSLAFIEGAENADAVVVGPLTSTTVFDRWVRDGCTTSDTSEVTVEVLPAVDGGAIGGGDVICKGADAPTLVEVVPASGGEDSFDYVWRQRPLNGSWSDIPNSNARTYSPGPLTVTTDFVRVATSTGGCGADESNVVRVEVHPDLLAGTIGASTAICHDTQPPGFTSSPDASGGTTNYTYSWYVSVDGGPFNLISGATSATYSEPSRLTSGRSYYRQVTDGCQTRTSNTVTVDVASPLVPGTIGDDQTVCEGKPPELIKSIKDASGGLGEGEYHWEWSFDGDNWEIIEGARDPDYLPSPIVKTTLFRRVYRNDCGEVISNVVKVTLANLQPGAVAGSQSICSGATPALFTSSVLASGGKASPTYLWQSSPNLSTWTNIGTATATTYQSGPLSTTTYFRRSANDTCKTVYTSAITVSVAAPLSGGTVGSNHSVCVNGTPALLTSSAGGSGGSGTSSYQWESSTDNVNFSPVVANGTGATYQPTAISQTTYYRRRYSNGCGSAYSNVVTVSVAPIFAGSVGYNREICYGTRPTAFTNLGSGSGGVGAASYFWQSSPNGSTWTTIGSSNSATYWPPNLTSTTYYRRAYQNTCGPVYTSSLRVTVAAPLTAGQIAGDQTICPGGFVSQIEEAETSTGGLGETTYFWLQSFDGVNWDLVPDAFERTYQPFEVSQTTWYKRVAVNDCDTLESNIVIITVANGGLIAPEDQTVPVGQFAEPLQSVDDGGAGALGGFIRWQRFAGGRWSDVRECEGRESCEVINTEVPGIFTYRRLTRFDACEGLEVESNYVNVNVVER